MALNRSDTAKANRAAAELKAKEELARKLDRKINAIVRKMAVDFASGIADPLNATHIERYQSTIRNALNTHYNTTAKAFGKEIPQYLRAIEGKRNPIARDLAKVANARGTTYKQQVRQMERRAMERFAFQKEARLAMSTNSILSSANERMLRATVKAEELLTKKLGKPPTRAQLAKAAKSIFQGQSLTHSKTIGLTETQFAAEEMKHLSRNAYTEAFEGPELQDVDINAAERSAGAVWVNQADSDVRDGDEGPFNHLDADGQRQEDGVFTVSGEQLAFPGDSSLGASPGNTINCRCSAVTELT